MNNDAVFDAGRVVRQEVLGTAHVDAQSASAFGQPLQRLVTEYCWGAVWTRPGLGRQARSLINLAMLTALGRYDELGLHVRGAINNGCTVTEIQEVLLQTAVYCGVPAAVNAFRVAEKALETIDTDNPDRADAVVGDRQP